MKDFIQELCREAADITLGHFGTAGVLFTKKSASDVVTEADLASHRHCMARIRERYPDHSILSEEGDTVVDASGDLWIIDPLDGSRNFATSTPQFGTMIAYARDGIVRMTAICLPVTRELYFAEKGGGAFLNGKPIRCSERTEWLESYGCGYASLKPQHQPLLHRLAGLAVETPFWMNAIGSIAVAAAYVASGRRDWYITGASNIWDTSPAALLLEESGCKVTDLAGNPWRYGAKGILAANEAMHATLLKIARG